jgi:lipopolysaccharide transport system ATP-binding protein
LEVGTGFHPELSGRENIFLNGAILGMSRAETRAKFDDVVEFADIGPFLDTPVKRYSSGMHMRLAFSVAAHLEAEVLLIDEVLAVGDSAFQKKCLRKMEGVAGSGRTVIFVSHNMVAVEKLCTRAAFLEDGRCTFAGAPGEAIQRYLANAAGPQAGTFSPEDVRSDGRAELLGYTIADAAGDTSAVPRTHDCFEVRVRVRVNEPIERPACSISIWNRMGTLMTAVNTTEQGIELEPLPRGESEIAVQLGPVPYLPGTYRMSFELVNPQGHIYAAASEAVHFEIGQRPLYGTRDLDHRWGCVFTPVSYAIRPCAPAMREEAPA